MTLELYHAAYSTCSQKVRLVLAEKDLHFESHLVNLAAKEHLTPEYLRLNPNGVVPTLVHDGQVVCDSSVIGEYLDEVFPASPLSPNTPHGRAQMRAWIRYFEEVATPAIRVPSLNSFFLKQIRPEQAAFQNFTATLPLRKDFYREMGPEGFSAEKVDAAFDRLRSVFARVDAALALMGDFLLGDFGLADIVLAPTMVRMIDLECEHLWSNLPRLAAWSQRIQNRASFPTAYFPGSRLGAGATPTTGPC